MPKEKLPIAAEQKIEEIKKAFTKPKRGSSLGELRRAMRGEETNPAEITSAEKEIGAAKPAKAKKAVVEKSTALKGAPMEELATRLMTEIKKADVAEKEKKERAKQKAYLKQFMKPENEPLASRESAKKIKKVLETVPIQSEQKEAKEAAQAFAEREATMELGATEKRREEEPSAPLESLPILENEEIPGIQMAGRNGPMKKPLPAPKKPWWKKAVDWLFS